MTIKLTPRQGELVIRVLDYGCEAFIVADRVDIDTGHGRVNLYGDGRNILLRTQSWARLTECDWRDRPVEPGDGFELSVSVTGMWSVRFSCVVTELHVSCHERRATLNVLSTASVTETFWCQLRPR